MSAKFRSTLASSWYTMIKPKNLFYNYPFDIAIERRGFVARAVVIDNDLLTHRTIRHLLGHNHHVLSYHRGTLAVDFIAQHAPDVVFLSMDLPDIRSLDLLESVCLKVTGPPVVALVDSVSPREIADVVRMGACDVVTRPIRPRPLEESLVRALSLRTACDRRSPGAPNPDIIGMSAHIARLRLLIERVGANNTPVLISGESGVGKELVARAVHQSSTRRRKPFQARNCGAIPETLFEAEMFGTERGAFTGSVCRPGAFELADGGTLFLDEVGELTPVSQVKLLRAVENRRFYRVGGTNEVVSDLRIVCATNRDLRSLTRDGRFREDLYYRINVMRLDVPALRHRAEDIPLLVEHFHKQLVRAGVHSCAQCFSPAAIRVLSTYDWPGNVRELKNVVTRALVMASGPQVQPAEIQFD
jgi:DNA-binding NtrC family response regulator